MYRHAEKLNKQFVVYRANLNNDLLNAIIEFGRVAKFRCRSNTAYKNFVEATFKGIADIKEVECEDTATQRKYTILEAKRI